MSTESVVEFNCGSTDTLHNTRKKATRGARAIQANSMMTIHNNLVQSEMAFVL